MKVGDLVRHRQDPVAKPGLVVDMTMKKVWRTNTQGKKINWGAVNPEPHAIVTWAHNDGTLTIPLDELEVMSD